MELDRLLPIILITLEWLGRLFFSAFLLLRRRPLTPTLAWLVAINTIPLVGIAAFLLIGDMRLRSSRQPRKRDFTDEHIAPAIQRWRDADLEWEDAQHRFDPVKDYAEAAGGLPALKGHHLDLLATDVDFFDRLIDDINAAEHEVFFTTYIWFACNASARLCDALIAAHNRGVDVRVMVDDAGRRLADHGSDLDRLERVGIAVVRALPVSFKRLAFRRLDARNHRKLAAIDARLAYCGSHNVTDPSFRSSGRRAIGPWIDATVRVEGPTAEAIRLVILRDLEYDADEQVDPPRPPAPPVPRDGPHIAGASGDGSLVQLVASSSAQGQRGVLEQAFHTALYAARTRVWITTPYFCPEDSVLAAIIATARRGVEVRLIVPERNDNRLVAAAEQSLWPELLDAGVRIYRYTPALLHTKTMLIDGDLGVIGSANMDIRSFEINLEATIFAFDPAFAAELERLAERYMDKSEELTIESAHRRWPIRLRDHVALLAKQLL